jgi:3D (Asp-Asp-Asp) domain-containing protein
MRKLLMCCCVAIFVLVAMPTQIASDQRVYRPAPAPVPKDKPLVSRGEVGEKDDAPGYREVIMESTAYSYTGSRTYTGTWPSRGTIAVDPDMIPLGTKLWVEGYGFGIAEDTGGAIKGNIVDVFLESEDACWRWGRRNVKVRVYE